MTKDDFLKLLLATFPPEPVPAQFFWKEDGHDDGYEFRRDLREWLAERKWTEIKMSDWTMAGNISHTRELLEPTTFLYYLPSLLVGVAEDDPGYLDWALEAIIPLGRDRKPKSKWWSELLATIQPGQSATLRTFLTHVRNDLLPSEKTSFVISAHEALTSESEAFWDTQIRLLASRTKQ
jgi:hypothetical protein